MVALRKYSFGVSAGTFTHVFCRLQMREIAGAVALIDSPHVGHVYLSQ